MEVLKPALAAAIFFFLTICFSYYFNPAIPHSISLAGWSVTIGAEAQYFISSPFNIQTEGSPVYNLYLPTVLIFLLGLYLKNLNKAFQEKCSLRAVFIMAIAASYVKSLGSMLYYRGYSDFGISLGTSIITLSFLVAFLISLEVYIERKERFDHLYGHFMFALLSSLVLLLGMLIFFSFFSTSSFIVHAMGLTAFMAMFVPFYERANIARFMREEGQEAFAVTGA
ncbi:MAG: hypothetical protein KGH94_04620 [Candidatus Micrarchaeota archaeon]|nr:hypothetical protein [Candidatus Micrarchaeota archaeon]